MLKLRADLDGAYELSHRLLMTLREIGIDLQPKQAHRLVGGLFGKRSWRTALSALKTDGALDVAPADHLEEQFLKAVVDCVGLAAFKRFPLENFPNWSEDPPDLGDLPYALGITKAGTVMVMAKQHQRQDGNNGFVTLEVRSPKEAGTLLGVAMLQAFAKNPSLLTRATELQIETDVEGLNLLTDTNPMLCPCCTALDGYKTYAAAKTLPVPAFLAQVYPVGPLVFFRPFADQPQWYAYDASNKTIAPARCSEDTFAAELPPRWVPQPGEAVWLADRLVLAEDRPPSHARGSVVRTWLDATTHTRRAKVKTARDVVEVPTELLIPQAPKGKSARIPLRTQAHLSGAGLGTLALAAP